MSTKGVFNNEKCQLISVHYNPYRTSYDGFNDYDLITQTGLGFAMKNSIYRLLEKLTDTEIIESNAEDGMAKKVRELFNI